MLSWSNMVDKETNVNLHKKEPVAKTQPNTILSHEIGVESNIAIKFGARKHFVRCLRITENPIKNSPYILLSMTLLTNNVLFELPPWWRNPALMVSSDGLSFITRDGNDVGWGQGAYSSSPSLLRSLHPVSTSFPIAGKNSPRPYTKWWFNPRWGPNGNFYPHFYLLCDSYTISLGWKPSLSSLDLSLINCTTSSCRLHATIV